MNTIFSKKQSDDPVLDDLARELQQVQMDMENVRARFNEATEHELIEQAVFEMKAIQARYAYFLRLMREYKGTDEGVRQAEGERYETIT